MNVAAVLTFLLPSVASAIHAPTDAGPILKSTTPEVNLSVTAQNESEAATIVSPYRVVFEPTSSLASYQDEGSCGPRGDDALANLKRCKYGSRIVLEEENENHKVKASINGCKYYAYTVHECRLRDALPVPFEPASIMVEYQDEGECGPRGDDAKAYVQFCRYGTETVVKEENENHMIKASVDGCNYYAYSVHRCQDRPVFDPTSALVSYVDEGSCGPRGGDATADLSTCKDGSIMVEHHKHEGYNVKARINGCNYYSYTIHKCK